MLSELKSYLDGGSSQQTKVVTVGIQVAQTLLGLYEVMLYV